MAQDTYDMDDAALDALLENTVSDDSEKGYHEVGGEPESGSENVSPSDDVDEGQSEDEEDVNHVDGADSEDEDPEDSLSTDEDEDKDEDGEPEEDDETLDDNSEDDSEDDSEADEEPLAFQPLRADGKEYPIESMQELYSLASKGINADRKWSEASKGRKVAATLEKNGLTPDDINLLVELKQGKKDAILSLLKDADIDPLDIDVDALDGSYKPNDHSVGDFEVQLDDVVARVKTKPRYEESVNVIMEQWDEQSKKTFYENPQILELLNIDMQPDESGSSMYDRVMPLADKMKALDSGPKKSDLEYYQIAGAKVIESIQQAAQSQATAQERKAQESAKKKKVVSKKKKAAASSGGRPTVVKQVDVSSMSDEELDAFLEKTS